LGSLKKLIGQTAIYGLSSIVGRLLNYLLVPLYTYTLPANEYGVVTELYSYVALVFAFALYGMETTFFRFSETESKPKKVLSTSSISVLASTLLFLLTAYVFRVDIAHFLGYQNHLNYITWFIYIIGFEALSAIPFAYLRQQNKALNFVSLKLLNIGITLSLNLFFILYCPQVMATGESHFLYSFVSSFFTNGHLVQYIFISNLIASGITFLLLLPIYKNLKFGFHKSLWKQMITYALPILVVNITGLIPISIDKILLPFLYSGSAEEGMTQLGIYGANAKIAVIMMLFIQTFRYAADPFFFAEAKNKNAKQTYARVMHWFVILGTFIFLSTMMFINIIQYFVGADYREGLMVVPVLLMANLMLGIYYNLSFWYKLSSKTIYGAWFSSIGAVIAILLNIVLVPVYGIMGAAWAVFAAYFVPVILSYLYGNKYYPIPYQLSSIIFYPVFGSLLFMVSQYFDFNMLYQMFTLLFFLLTAFVVETKINPFKIKRD